MKDATDRLIQRTVRITKRQPQPPRELIFDEATNLLTWQPPPDARMVTHFRVRIGSDSDVPTYQPPVGQTTLQLTSGITRVFITSYNQVADLESSPAMLDLTPTVPAPPPDGGGPPVTGFTYAQEVGTRYTDSLRRVHLTIGFTPIVAVPRIVTYLISMDAKVTWIWGGFQEMKTVGQVLNVDWIAIPDDADWAVACIAGNPGGDTVPLTNAQMLAKYPGIVTSNLFPVLGLPKPPAAQGIEATVGSCTNVITSDGLTQHGVIPGVVYKDPAGSLDFFVRITVQDLNASHVAIDKEKPHGGTQITGSTHTENELLVIYTPGLAFVRYRFYIANRESQGDGDFANTDTNTLQDVKWNADPVLAKFFDVPITIPPFTPLDPSDTFNVLSVTGREVGPKYQDEKAGLHTVVGLKPVIDANFAKPHTVTLWLDFGNGVKVWQGWYSMSFAGQEIKIGEQTLGSDGTRKSGTIWVPANTAQGNWKVWCAPGQVDKNVDPTGYPTSTFFVKPVGPTSPSGITTCHFLPDPLSGDPITYYKNDLGMWFWEYYRLEWTPPTQLAEPDYWFALITIQKGATIGGVWTPAPDPEGRDADPYKNYLGRMHDQVLTPAGLNLDQATVMQRGGAYPSTWIIPPAQNTDGTPNPYREFRFLMYSVSRLGTDSSGSGGEGTYTLQTSCWPGGKSFFILTPSSHPGDLDLRHTNPSSITGPLSGGAGMPITIAPGDITGDYLEDDSILARHMHEDSITAANKALAANSVVDGNVKDVGVVKLIYGTNVFTGDVILSRGKSLPVIILQNSGINLFGESDAALGSAGLTAKPNVAIQSGGISLFAGATSKSVTITSSAITFWSVNGDATKPYTTVSALGIVMTDGGTNTFTLNSSGFDIAETGGVHVTIQGGVFQIIKPGATPAVDGNNLFKFDVGGLIISKGISGNANYTALVMDSTGVKVSRGGPNGATVAVTADAVTLVSSNTGPSVRLTASDMTLMNATASGPVVKLSANGLELTNGGVTGASVTITASAVTIVKGSLTAATISGGSLNIATGSGMSVKIDNTTAGVQVSGGGGTETGRVSSNLISVYGPTIGSEMSPISLLVGRFSSPDHSLGFNTTAGFFIAGVNRCGFDGVWKGGLQWNDHVYAGDFGIMPGGAAGPAGAVGASGSFVAGGKTVTVWGGIITSIV